MPALRPCNLGGRRPRCSSPSPRQRDGDGGGRGIVTKGNPFFSWLTARAGLALAYFFIYILKQHGILLFCSWICEFEGKLEAGPGVCWAQPGVWVPRHTNPSGDSSRGVFLIFVCKGRNLVWEIMKMCSLNISFGLVIENLDQKVFCIFFSPTGDTRAESL